MKSLLMSFVMLLGLTVVGQAGLVTLDNYSAGGILTPASNINAQGAFASALPSSLLTPRFSGVAGSAPSGILVDAGSTITYTFAPGSLTSAAYAANNGGIPNAGGNWLINFNTTSVTDQLTARVTVNNLTAQSTTVDLTGSGSFAANFLTAAAGTASITSVVFTFSGAGSATIDSISATPEPASMLTAGLFTLMGGLVYRRRKAAKIVA